MSPSINELRVFISSTFRWCRPYFIGITGERYGGAPELHEYYSDSALLANVPWLEEAEMEGASIIDLEFRHAVLDRLARAESVTPPAATFFVRRHRRRFAPEVKARETSRTEDFEGTHTCRRPSPRRVPRPGLAWGSSRRGAASVPVACSGRSEPGIPASHRCTERLNDARGRRRSRRVTDGRQWDPQ